MKSHPQRKRRNFVRDAKKSSKALPVYKNPRLSAEQRVKDLLARMTLEEKAAQMMCVWQKKADLLVDVSGDFDPAKARVSFKTGHGLGQVGRPSDAGKGKDARGMANLTNDIQRFFIENTRLGIPVFFHEECLHGHAAMEATSFSQPIGLAATFNPQLVQALYAMTAEEARVRGTHQATDARLMLRMRDPRWGRVEETFGEDPLSAFHNWGLPRFEGFRGMLRLQTRNMSLRRSSILRRTGSRNRDQTESGPVERTDGTRAARNFFASVQGGVASRRRD